MLNYHRVPFFHVSFISLILWLMSTNSIYGGTCIQRVYMCVYIHMFHLKCGVPQLCFLVDKPPIDYIMFYVPFLFLSLTLLRLKKTAVLQGVGAIKGTALKCPSGCCCIHPVIFQLGFFIVLTFENIFIDVLFGVMQPVLTRLPDSFFSIINSIRRVGFARYLSQWVSITRSENVAK